MKTLDKISNVMSRAAASTASLAKVALLSRRPTAENGSESGEIVVLGNGPSLRDTIDRHGDWLSHRQLMAVNFAANAPDFRQLRPGRYILADPHFFEGTATDPNVASLWKALRNADWPINLYVPAPRAGLARQLAEGSECLSVKTFNLIPSRRIPPADARALRIRSRNAETAQRADPGTYDSRESRIRYRICGWRGSLMDAHP